MDRAELRQRQVTFRSSAIGGAGRGCRRETVAATNAGTAGGWFCSSRRWAGMLLVLAIGVSAHEALFGQALWCQALWAQGQVPPAGRIILPAPFNPPVFNANPTPNDLLMGSQPIPPRRDLTNALEEADINLLTEEYLPAIQRLTYLLRQDEDYFVDREGARSMQEEAVQRLMLLPEAGRKQLELQQGSAGRPLVDAALKVGDAEKLVRLAREYVGTTAGEDAALWLSGRAIDRGRPWEASRWLGLLPRGERAARLEPRLSRYRELVEAASASGAPAVAGTPAQPLAKSIQLLSGSTSVVSDWPMVRGSSRRTGASLPATLAGDPAWSTSYQLSSSLRSSQVMLRANEIQWQSIMDLVDNQLRDEQKLRVPSAQPIVSGNLVVIRLPDALVAFDLSTGALKWISADRDAQLTMMLKSLGEAPRSEDAIAVRMSMGAQLTTFLQQRMYRDATWGSLSTDGRYVYSTSGLPVPQNPFSNGQIVRNLLTEPKVNTMRVHELSTGRLVAEVGGSREAKSEIEGPVGFDAPGVAPAAEPGVNRVPPGDSKKDPLAGGYFLGPPLPLGGLLYALHESAGEIRLVVLENTLTPTFFSHGDLTEAGRREPASSIPAMDAADADEPGGFKLRWLQSLVTAETDLAMGPIRSVAGLSPTEADGLLICPTGSGRVVAVDPLRRQLVWSYAYAATNASLQLDQRAMFLAQMTGRNPATLTDEESSRWIEGLPLVVGHRVLLTPRESHELHCLDLASGKLLWKKPREDWLSVAGVVRDQVVLVGRNRVMAVSLQEGQPVWRQSTMITPPVGTPVLAGDVLYVPLENQEVVAIDAVTGRHLARAAIDPACAVGNLVRAGDRLVMQGIDGVTVFQGVGPLEAKSQELLAADDTKARGLALRGALRLFRGATDAGFEDLKNSARDGGDLRSQQLLISVILDGLQSDFEKYRDAGDRLEQFHLTPRQQGIYLQRLASGLAARDDHEAALGAFLRLWDTQGREEPEATFANGDWTCRLDHLLAAGIETSLAKLDATGRERGQRRIDERIAQDLADMATLPITTLPIEKRLDRVAQMAVVFGTRSPAITEALKELIKSPLLMDEPVLAEQWLMPMALDEGHPLRGLAIARWIELLARQGKTDWAVKLFPLIPRDAEALRQMAGAEELVALQADARFLRAEADVPYWKGVITDTRRKPVQPGLIRGMAIEPMGGRSLLTDDWSFEMDAGVQNIVAVDALGNLRWQMPTAYLERDGTQMNQMFFGGNMQRHQLFTSGSLQVFSLGGHFTVVDPLSDPTGPRVLWQRKLLPSSASSSASRAIGTQIRRHPNGRLYSQVVDQMGMVSGQLHGVAAGIVFYQVGARLFAAELATGEAIWSRQNIPKGAEVSIDSSAVVIYDNFSHDATILKTLSGELIAETTTPGPTERLWQRGSEAISLVRGETGVPGETGLVLAYHDWLHPQASWRETLAPMTSVTVVEPASRRDLDIDHPADSPGNDYPQIATLSSGGRFRVIDRKSRNVVLTAKLDEALSDGILLVRKKADQYLVIASQEVDQSDGLRIQGSDPSAIAIDGMFYGIDAKTGGVNWTVSVPQTAVDLRQLAELPISVFCARVTQPPRIVDGRMFLKSELRATVVDHRTGQLVYATIEPQTTGGFVIQQQPDKRRLIVNLLGWMLEIDFAEPAAEPGAPKTDAKSPLPTITPAGPVPAAPAPAAPVPTPRPSPAKSIP